MSVNDDRASDVVALASSVSVPASVPQLSPCGTGRSAEVRTREEQKVSATWTIFFSSKPLTLEEVPSQVEPLVHEEATEVPWESHAEPG